MKRFDGYGAVHVRFRGKQEAVHKVCKAVIPNVYLRLNLVNSRGSLQAIPQNNAGRKHGVFSSI